MLRRTTALLAAAVCFAGCRPADEATGAASPAATGTASSSAANTAFDALVESVTRDFFHDSPELATYLGVDEQTGGPGYNGRLDDYGPAARERARALPQTVIARLEAVDAAALDDRRRLTREVLIEQARAVAAVNTAARGPTASLFVDFRLYPVNQFDGVTIDTPQLMAAQQPVTSDEEARLYVARLRAFGAAFDDALESVRADDAAGLRPPDFVIDKAIAVIDAFVAPSVEQNVLYKAFADKLAAAAVATARDRSADAAATLREVVYPAYGKLRAGLAELRTRTEHDASLSSRPNGGALYRALIRLYADSELAPDEIHRIGLAEVARISAEMNTILDAQKHAPGPLGERMTRLSRERRFLYPNTDEGKRDLLADLNGYVAEVQALAPQWFSIVPTIPVEIRRAPIFAEESGSIGYYDYPSVDGTRPGIYWINLRDTANNPRFSLKTLTYHEAVPGHHYQIALGLQQDAPLLRQLMASTSAYAEGWALYAEQLAVEMGLYRDDPYGNIGRLRDELFRAARLVVDTGIHSMGWSRERAIAYLVDTGSVGESEAVSEVERYVVWPGQALGYKIGMLKLLELRQRAQAELGERFDIRTFHEAVLIDGGLPLPILERRINGWIATQKSSDPR